MNHINYVFVVFDDSAMGLKKQNYDVYIIVVCDMIINATIIFLAKMLKWFNYSFYLLKHAVNNKYFVFSPLFHRVMWLVVTLEWKTVIGCYGLVKVEQCWNICVLVRLFSYVFLCLGYWYLDHCPKNRSR